jgi:DNA-3-methyladenine glycosylase II
MPRLPLEQATAEVVKRDPDLAAALEVLRPLTWRPRSGDPFASLVRAIVFQQLAGRAAAAIHGRLVDAVGGAVTPAAILAAPEGRLLGAGLSRAKAVSLADLATKVLDGTVPLARLSRLPDDDIVTRLSSVRGIGRWTAEMFLIFELRRLDVWPVDDLGVRRGWARIHRLAEPPSPKALQLEGDRFRPYRTPVALLCWRAAVTTLPDASPQRAPERPAPARPRAGASVLRRSTPPTK